MTVICTSDIPTCLRSNIYVVGHVISHEFTFNSNVPWNVKFSGKRDCELRPQISSMSMKQRHD